jgi:hypothetical protein
MPASVWVGLLVKFAKGEIGDLPVVGQFIKFRDYITGYHFAQVVLKQRVSPDDKASLTIVSFLFSFVRRCVASVDMTGGPGLKKRR